MYARAGEEETKILQRCDNGMNVRELPMDLAAIR
jgi:hypothetical protein